MKKIICLLLAITLLVTLLSFAPTMAATEPIAVTIYSQSSGDYDDGDFPNSHTVYNTVWTDVDAAPDVNTWLVIGQWDFSGTFSIYRAFLYFDTSSIPVGATIVSASVNLYGRTDSSDTDFSITIQNGQPTYPHAPVVVGDYNKSNYSGDGGSLSSSSWTLVDYNTITLNGDGRSWINDGGVTKFMIRSSLDIAGTEPTQKEHVTAYAAEEAGTSKDPYLYVEYTEVPLIETDACSSVQPTSFDANGDITTSAGTVTTRGFHYSEVFDDFEWGIDEDPLTDRGGAIAWSANLPDSGKAEIDTGRKYAGTRSARLYRNTSDVWAYFTQAALSSTQVWAWRFRRQAARHLQVYHGNGSYRIQVRVYNNLLQYYDTTTHDIGTVSSGAWHHIAVKNVNWAAHTYDIYLNGILAKSGATMQVTANNNNEIRYRLWTYTGDVWIDNVGVWDVEDESGSFGEGEYSLEITGLDPETTYYVQAFAENSVGFGYGDVVSQLTSPTPAGYSWGSIIG